MQVTRMLWDSPQSKTHSVNTTRSEALFICCFDWQKLFSTDVLEQPAPALKRWFSKQTKKQQKTKMKLKRKVKIYLFLIQHVTAVRSGPAGQSQGIFLSNPCHDEGMSKKHCHNGSKHYPAAAQSSLASHTEKSKSNVPDMKILNVLGKAWEKPWGGLSPFLNGLVREAGDVQHQEGKLVAEHLAPTLPTPKKQIHNQVSLLLANLKYLFCSLTRCIHPATYLSSKDNSSRTQPVCNKDSSSQDWFLKLKLCSERIHHKPNEKNWKRYPMMQVKRKHYICTVCINKGK